MEVVDLNKLIVASLDTYIHLRNIGNEAPDEELIRFILNKNDIWKALGDKDKEEVIAKIHDKKEEYFAPILDTVGELEDGLTELDRVVDAMELKLDALIAKQEERRGTDKIADFSTSLKEVPEDEPFLSLADREKRKKEHARRKAEQEKDWGATPVLTLEERARRKAEREKAQDATPIITLEERARRKAEQEKDWGATPVLTLEERARRKAEQEKDWGAAPVLTLEERARRKAEREERTKGHEDGALF